MRTLAYEAHPGLSHSEWRDYRACEARWHAVYVAKTEPRRVATDAMDVGTYLHALILEPDKAPAVLEALGGTSSRGASKGAPKAAFAAAEEAAACALRQMWVQQLLAAPDMVREAPLYGTLAGVAWKGQADLASPTRGVWDVKKVGGKVGQTDPFADQWDEELKAKVPWFDAPGVSYWTQLALYRHLQGVPGVPVGIIGVAAPTETRPANCQIVAVDADLHGLDLALETLARDGQQMANWHAWWAAGQQAPRPPAHCNVCAYCLARETGREPQWLT